MVISRVCLVPGVRQETKKKEKKSSLWVPWGGLSAELTKSRLGRVQLAPSLHRALQPQTGDSQTLGPSVRVISSHVCLLCKPQKEEQPTSWILWYFNGSSLLATAASYESSSSWLRLYAPLPPSREARASRSGDLEVGCMSSTSP